MAQKKSSWNFRFGNKGFIFLLDAVIAISLVIVILTASLFFASRAEESSISKLQASRVAHDIFAILDHNDNLRLFEISQIQNEIDAILPDIYSLDYKISCENRVYDSRTKIPEEFIFSGERVFVDQSLNNCIVRYWLWLK